MGTLVSTLATLATIAFTLPVGIRMASFRQRETGDGWKHGSCREEKFMQVLYALRTTAYYTTHSIVSHRRGPWSGPGAQRAWIRMRNCC